MKTFSIHPLTPEDRPFVSRTMVEHWGSEVVVSRRRVHSLKDLPGFIAVHDDERIGIAIYRLDGDACELVVIQSLLEGVGIGSALIAAVKQAATTAGCRRLWVITTNDNLPALRFYQKRGFHLVAVYPNALDYTRRIKPGVPLVGLEGIPLRDEVELEMALTAQEKQYG